MSQQQDEQEKDIAITLPGKYWVLILAMLEPVVYYNNKIMQEMREQKIDLETVPGPRITALIGPLLMRGMIVKALVAEGVMREEADAKLGIDALMDKVNEFRAKHPPE